MTIKSHILSLAGHFIPALRNDTKPLPLHETEHARWASYTLGQRAGRYLKDSTMEEYLSIRQGCHRKVKAGAFNVDEFNRGHNEVSGWPYDFHQEFGDLFRIGHAYHTKPTPEAIPARRPVVPYVLVNAQ